MLGILVLLSSIMMACGDNTPTEAPVTMAPPVTTAPANTTAPSSPTLAPRSGYSIGETKRLGAGLVQSWVKLDENNKPVAVGLTFSETALLDLPVNPNNQ